MADRPVALITGAGGGIGRHLARAFADAGYDLVLGYRRAPLEPVPGATAVVADLTESSGVAALFDAVPAAGLSALVNCAGAYPVQPFLDTGPEDWRAALDLGVVAAYACVRAAADRMPGGGGIVNVASIAAHRGPVDQAPYAAAKAALLSLTRTAALALGDRGIRVNAVSPGLVHRPGIEDDWPDGVDRWRRRSPLGTLVDPADLAALCVFLAGPSARSITGQEYVVDAGVTAAEDY